MKQIPRPDGIEGDYVIAGSHNNSHFHLYHREDGPTYCFAGTIYWNLYGELYQ